MLVCEIGQVDHTIVLNGHIDVIEAEEKQFHPLFTRPSINLAKIQGGTVYNKEPNPCEMFLDIRYLPDQSPKDNVQQIQEITDSTVTTHILNNPVKTNADNPYGEALGESIKRITQLEKVIIFGQHGSSDGQFFTEYGGSAVEARPKIERLHSKSSDHHLKSSVHHSESSDTQKSARATPEHFLK
ncbi:peptidase dimerization domain-containing protein [Oceanobacillus arenosus]|uniref:peptidase dimerization domain-containing protein n=1 Tax=Oceanobacillus arenosus TaxID=1229153 RepID=UPI001FE88564|nr:peptidase dimerization domain-containing protein [Oceanobacillus arenosus]